MNRAVLPFELPVVVAILGIIAAVAVPRLGKFFGHGKFEISSPVYKLLVKFNVFKLAELINLGKSCAYQVEHRCILDYGVA